MNFFQLAAAAYRNRERIKKAFEQAKPLLEFFGDGRGEALLRNVHQIEEELGLTKPPEKDGAIPARYDVEWIQRTVNKDLSISLDVDGKYGHLTREAVERFQKKHRLEADGWVGPLTAELMESLERK